MEYAVESGLGVDICGIAVSDEDVGHALRDELEGLHVVLVLVEFFSVVLDVDVVLAGLLLDLVEEEGDVVKSTLSNLGRDADVCDRGPGGEEVVEELQKIGLRDAVALSASSFFLLGDEFEGDACLVGIVAAFQDLHVLDEVLEVDLPVVVQVKCVEHALGKLLCAVQTQNTHVLLEVLAGNDPAVD